ncbi:hypothetical protein L208DRAFT_1539698 [Tricholoma matsutake]|nr:hypothetical protein L208DRAFT_1539698 [Tricholoma matsutake 945]
MYRHDVYMMGSSWLWLNYNQEFQAWAFCEHDGQLETMEHVLTDCETPGQKEVWEEARSLWECKRGIWFEPSMGAVLGSPLSVFKDKEGNRLIGNTQLYQILMVEATYLIWKLRCAHVCKLKNQPFPSQEVCNRWHKTINDRLELECWMRSPKFEMKAMSKELVLETWKGTLHEEDGLPDDWTGVARVLVGMDLVPQLGVG